MGKFVFYDECLVPRRLSFLHYKGPDPIGFQRDFRTALRFIFEVSTTRCRQRKLLWDYTGDPIRFYNEWWIKKELSRFSDMWVSIRILGYVSKGKQDGNFSMEMYGEIRNTFKPSNWFTKYVWILYNYMFYNKIRERYVQMCRNYISKYLSWCKEKYNLKTVATSEAEIAEFEEEMETEGVIPREGEVTEGAYVGPPREARSEPEKHEKPPEAQVEKAAHQAGAEQASRPGEHGAHHAGETHEPRSAGAGYATATPDESAHHAPPAREEGTYRPEPGHPGEKKRHEHEE